MATPTLILKNIISNTNGTKTLSEKPCGVFRKAKTCPMLEILPLYTPITFSGITSDSSFTPVFMPYVTYPKTLPLVLYLTSRILCVMVSPKLSTPYETKAITSPCFNEYTSQFVFIKIYYISRMKQ